jgi:hypothetical protein
LKLIRFMTVTKPIPYFGVVIQELAVPFEVLQRKVGKSCPSLNHSQDYLANLPKSEADAKELMAWGEQPLKDLRDGESFTLDAVRLAQKGGVYAST